ncbi:MAG TPA: FlgD immunoglobulin-like domain containing protein [Candidatus Limnocylindria bacterium]|nr:FlgD immunoglobulin-like domain containing protein [Candidatus Limnocylindria bacterium]
MRMRLFVLGSFLIVSGLLIGLAAHDRMERGIAKSRLGEPGPYPSDWFGMQRAFPGTSIDQAKYRAAVEQARVERADLEAASRTGASGSSSMVWTQVGPFNVGGRVTALAVAPGAATLYLGSANGGVFKSTNSGVNWTPVFDATGVFSIGALALSPDDPDVIYCGTGEANSSVDSYDGSGVYVSADGGQEWSSLGLEETARIARIAVDPQNPDRIFVAAMGRQFSTGPDRGLYRSEDRGQSWNRVLFVNDSTGACDVVINPANPDTVFCATWERIRRPTYRRAYGPGSRIWRSIDHGATWAPLAGGLPTPSDSVGRIGLAIAPSRPSRVYAQVIGGALLGYGGRGMYRTDNGGASWARVDVSGFTSIFGGFGWYFGDVAVDPLNPNRVYALGVDLIRSINGGANYSSILASAHVDQHAMWIDPANPFRIYLGNDGGFYSTTGGGGNWAKSLDLPITQFYAGAIDPSNPSRLLGGTQDNNSLQTLNGNPSAWIAMLGGDGFYCLVDPTNPNIVFAEYQNGSGGQGPFRSTEAGLSGTFEAPTGINAGDRFNWSTPFVISPSDHKVLLVGSQRVYRSVDNGLSYAPISGNLTTDPPAQLTFGTITTLDIAASDASYYYAGTDDGKVWRSTDEGDTWEDISSGLPVRWVTRVTADPLDARTVYVTLSGFGLDETLAHVYRGTHAGDTWTSISNGLLDVPANDILVDPLDTNRLYLATDVGVYASVNAGQGWFPLGTGMPVQTIFDLTLHSPSRTLVAATHGRSQWKLDLSQLPVAVGPSGARSSAIALSAPAPNPSRGRVAFSVDLPAPAETDVAVFDPLGRNVRGVFKGFLAAGRHPFSWNGLDASGRRSPAGVYYLRAVAHRSEAAPAIQTRRLVRIN